MSVGPIMFGHPTARNQLRSEGLVYTFRVSDRTTGSTWWRASRTGEKEGNAIVTHAATIDPGSATSLHPYQPESGFRSVTAWQATIEEILGVMPESGHIYQVRDPDHPRYAGVELEVPGDG